MVQNSFQYFSRLRVLGVIITTLYLLTPTSWYQKTAQSSGNKLPLILSHNRLPWQQYDLLKTSLNLTLSAYNSKTSSVTPYSCTIARALISKAQVICARSKENISVFRFLWRQHEHKKAKLSVNFLAFPSVNFFKTWRGCNHIYFL